MNDKFGRPIHPGFDIIYVVKGSSDVHIYRAKVVNVWDDRLEVYVAGRRHNTWLRAMHNVVVI